MTASMKARDACSVGATGMVGDIQVATERHGEHGLRQPLGAGGFFDCGNHGALRSISLSFASYRTAFVEEFPAFDAFAQQFWVRGSAQTIVDGTAVAVSSDQSPVISPGARVTATCGAGFEQCALRID